MIRSVAMVYLDDSQFCLHYIGVLSLVSSALVAVEFVFFRVVVVNFAGLHEEQLIFFLYIAGVKRWYRQSGSERIYI